MKGKSLRQVTLHVTLEAEDAAVELLARHFKNPPSVYTNEETKATSVTVQCEQESEWTPQKRRSLLAGIRFFKECGLDIGPGKLTAKRIKREDWAESWKRHFKPLEIGRSLLIKPSWNKRKPKRGQAVVVLDPGLSFGTGHHATTSFCLHAITQAKQPGIDQSFLDIGTGSGILAISAAKLGYRPIHAFDFDAEAVRVAQANANANRVSDNVELARQDLTRLPAHSSQKYDVICANLIFDLLLSQGPKIVNRLKPEGQLVLAGILATQFSRVKSAFARLNMKLVEERSEKEWRSGTFVFR